MRTNLLLFCRDFAGFAFHWIAFWLRRFIDCGDSWESIQTHSSIDFRVNVRHFVIRSIENPDWTAKAAPDIAMNRERQQLKNKKMDDSSTIQAVDWKHANQRRATVDETTGRDDSWLAMLPEACAIARTGLEKSVASMALRLLRSHK
jgi:hypothetical protein